MCYYLGRRRTKRLWSSRSSKKKVFEGVCDQQLSNAAERIDKVRALTTGLDKMWIVNSVKSEFSEVIEMTEWHGLGRETVVEKWRDNK